MKCNNPWNEISTPDKNANIRRIDSKHPMDLFWGRDTNGNYLFLFFFKDSEGLSNTKFPLLNGIEVLFGKSHQQGKMQLSLILKERSNWEIFLALCNDIVQATFTHKIPSKAVPVVLRRLNRWREFLKIKRPPILTEEKIKGLIGELLFIKNHLLSAFGIGNAITFWQGPEGTLQDFNVKEHAIEIKCQVGTSNPSIKISTAEQLWPQLPSMYLYVVTLGKCPQEDPNSVNLPGLTKEIRTLLEDSSDSIHLERFNDLLFSIGYIDSDHYLPYSYLFTEEQMYKVEGEFPRLPLDSIQHGIHKISYSISLRECEPYKCWPDWIMRS